MSNGNLKKKGRETRQISALARRQADITKWESAKSGPIYEYFSDTQEQWVKYCEYKKQLAQKEVEILKTRVTL